MGPNFFIWLAMVVVVVATILALMGYGWVMWIAYPLAAGLAVFNKWRAVRRRKAEMSRTFD